MIHHQNPDHQESGAAPRQLSSGSNAVVILNAVCRRNCRQPRPPRLQLHRKLGRTIPRCVFHGSRSLRPREVGQRLWPNLRFYRQAEPAVHGRLLSVQCSKLSTGPCKIPPAGMEPIAARRNLSVWIRFRQKRSGAFGQQRTERRLNSRRFYDRCMLSKGLREIHPKPHRSI